MSYLGDKDFLIEVAKGNVAGHSLVHKFGKNAGVTTAYESVSYGGVYETPQVAGATTLRVKAGGNVNDTAAGTGAREITFEGLDETGAFATEAVATAGASASLATGITFLRMFRYYVSASGRYATTAAGSHLGDIVVENGAGGTDWGTIENTTFSRGQSVIGSYSIPLGKTGYFLGALANIDVTAPTANASVLVFKRENILETAAPYSAMTLLDEWEEVSGEFTYEPRAPIKLPALTDFGFLANVSTSTGSMSVNFGLLLVDD